MVGRIPRTSVWLVAGLLLLLGCGGGAGSSGPTGDPPPLALGDPIRGLSAAELAAFERGRIVFSRRFAPSKGLGPFYNATSCASCHSTPIPGGSSRLYRNFYLAVWGPPAQQEPIPPFLGAVVPAYGTGDQHTTATFSLAGGRPNIPATFSGWPVVSAQRNAIPIFGTGLFEFVSDATILENADGDDADGDGVSGRFNTDFGAIGRFGVKAQSHNVERFTRGPLQNQMGITSDPLAMPSAAIGAGLRTHPQVSADPDEPTIDHDGVPDPEISRGDLSDLIAFTRFLAPPQKQPFDDAARRGEATFEAVGCTLCHVPSLPSSRGPVEAYTDLLLHDMGPELADGISMGEAQSTAGDEYTTENEYRTQPLWGVSMHGPWLHDGRAATLREAVELHAGEAEAIRDAFLALPPAEQADLLRFLELL
jgi:CxxC motif-containing protein (DUF1111 family)